MRAFVTGATGFLGGRLTQKLLERGDDVVALVRRAVDLDGAQLVRGDVSDRGALADAMQGCDAVFHVAAMYKVGIPRGERAAMVEVNVRGTENVLGAADAADIDRVVYVSTVNVFGNTRGAIVDESYERPPGDWLSTYDWTKYLAHQVARQHENVVIAQPGAIYGPGDHSELGAQLDQARRGRLLFKALADVGVNAVHIDDAADGLLLVHDRGRLGESYVLGGQITRLGEMIDLASPRPVRLAVPTALLRLATPAGPLIGKVMGTGPNLRELISASAGVTYWATDAKARRETGYQPRDLAAGLATLEP
jgi:nucleoside-diphosphate-sugar epimerase